jgi:hypothetical protein
MLNKRLRHRKNAGARPEPDPRSPLGQGRQALIKLGKVLDRGRAVVSRYCFHRRIELDLQMEPSGDTTKTDDLGSDRKCGHELRALQRLGLFRQYREPAIYSALPFICRRGNRPRRQAA